MRVRLTFVETNIRNEELRRCEEILVGESEKNPSRKYVGQLVRRHHPEWALAGGVMFLTKIEETELGWSVGIAKKLTGNRWLRLYAKPLEDVPQQITAPLS